MQVSTKDLARRIPGCPKLRIPFPRDESKNRDRKVYPRVWHELTEEQIQKVVEAIGDGSDWPKHTDDARVNFAVDCLVSFEWDERPSFAELEPEYLEEIEAFKVAVS